MNRRRTKIRRWVYNHIPVWFRKYSFEVFTAILCLFGGIPLLFGQIDPTSLEASLPHELVFAWGFILCIGSAGTLIGLYKATRTDILEDQIFWRRIEAWGLTALAYAGYIYAIIIMVTQGSRGWLGGCLILCFAFTCHSREIDEQLRITDVLHIVGIDERH